MSSALLSHHPGITMQAATSSQIESHGYCPASKTLAMRFHRKPRPDGAVSDSCVYHYPAVEPHQYDALLKAASIGSHWTKHLRDQLPVFEKIFDKERASSAPKA